MAKEFKVEFALHHGEKVKSELDAILKKAGSLGDGLRLSYEAASKGALKTHQDLLKLKRANDTLIEGENRRISILKNEGSLVSAIEKKGVDARNAEIEQIQKLIGLRQKSNDRIAKGIEYAREEMRIQSQKKKAAFEANMIKLPGGKFAARSDKGWSKKRGAGMSGFFDRMDDLAPSRSVRQDVEATTSTLGRLRQRVTGAYGAADRNAKTAETSNIRFLRRWRQSLGLVLLALGAVRVVGGQSQVVAAQSNILGKAMGILINEIMKPFIPITVEIAKGIIGIADAYRDIPEPLKTWLSTGLGLVTIGITYKVLGGTLGSILGGGAEGAVGGALGAGLGAKLKTAIPAFFSSAIGGILTGLAVGLAAVWLMVETGVTDWLAEKGREFSEDHPLIMQLIKMITAPIGALGAAAIDLVTGQWSKIPEHVADIFDQAYGNVWKFAGDVVTSLADLALKGWEGAREIGSNILDGISTTLDGVGDALGEFWDYTISFLTNLASHAWNAATDIGRNIIDGIRSGFGNINPLSIGQSIISGAGNYVHSAIRGFATGGPVTDDGLIYAHKDEYVLNRVQAQAYRSGRLDTQSAGGDTYITNNNYITAKGATPREFVPEIMRELRRNQAQGVR